METIGDYEFSHKELIGHGAFAVVFKGQLRKNPDFIVAIKSITKKNINKSQNLLEKEIKILKELTALHHENVVALYDCKETALNVFLVMEYCNGGDLADYLSHKGTLSEDTIRLFLFQMAGAMNALHAKDIVHRDLKPQNILLSYADDKTKDSVRPQDIRLKIADFGFARFLQDGVMAATLCGSPMYMAPEVIMSLQYDAKADLWSIGTIVFQCLTGRAPFQATSPQALKQFYEKNANLSPKIPSGTSPELADLLFGLLRRNAGDRMSFDKFFNHPFLKRFEFLPSLTDPPASTTPKTITLGSSTSPKITLAPRRAKIAKPVSRAPSSPCSSRTLRRGSSSSPEETDDFVMVPSNLPSHPPVIEYLDRTNTKGNARNSSLALASSPPRPSFLPISEPIPVPTQRDVYQQMHSNEGLPSPTKSSIPRSQPISMKRGSEREYTRTAGPPIGSLSPPSVQFMIGTPPGGQTRRRSVSGSSCETPPPVSTWTVSPVSAGKITPTCSPLRRSGTSSSPLLNGPMAVISNFISDNNNIKQSPLMTFGTRAMTLPEISEAGGFKGFPDTPPLNIDGPVTFLAPELPEETLLEREHNETLAKLNFVVALSDCIFEIALNRDPPGPLSAILAHGNNISNDGGSIGSSTTNETTKRAEKLVLAHRAMQLLDMGLKHATEQLHSGQLRRSTSVKYVMSLMRKKLCTTLNECKQLLKDESLKRVLNCNITVEKILYEYAIKMCQDAAVDELFSNMEQCFRRYQTAQILLHSLSQQVHHHKDRSLLKKYKDAVEKRLYVLQQQGYIYST